ncbi:MAG TPA: hypothetical protein VNX68_17585 [Nitrosopumilaceae archaeon]|jgi:hypothetical protein|nr:hypothetical protein [Nitrosopumilaceae archaeon]
MSEKSTRELKLEAALQEIIENAPTQKPAPLTSYENDYQLEDYGYNSARWHDAEIARKALEI